MIEDTSQTLHSAAEPIPVVVVEDETQDDGGIDLVALAASFLAQWRLAFGVALIVAICGFVYVLRLKPQFVATATILPQEGRSSDTLASLFSSRSVGGLYSGLLRSRTVQDQVIDRANLLQVYHTTDRAAARGALTGTSTFAETGDGLMTISVRDGDASLAALIANTYLDALQELNESMGLQQSTRTRQFFETQLQQERTSLTEAEDRYKKLQGQTGLVQPEAQIASGIGAIQGTRTQIQSLQVQRARLLQSETEQNPDVRALDAQIGQLQAQERNEQSSGAGAGPGGAPSATVALQQNLELQRAQRDVGYYNALVTSLGNEFETARLNEIASRSAFQVVDRAIPPETKAYPPRKPYFGISLAFAALAGLLAVVLKLLYLRIMAHAKTRTHLRVLRGALR